MNILIVGSGAREHALVKKLMTSMHTTSIYCCPGNGGIEEDAICVNIKTTDVDLVIAFAQQKKIDLVVVTSRQALAVGMVEALEAKGICAFGPSAAACIIENDRLFTKTLLEKYGIPVVKYHLFDSSQAALTHLMTQNVFPVILKNNHAGNENLLDTFIAYNAPQAMAIVERMFQQDGCQKLLIEPYIIGPKVSAVILTDGVTVKALATAQSFKRTHDGENAPYTHGMGAVAPSPYYPDDIAKVCVQGIYVPALKALRNEGIHIKGCLTFNIVITPHGPQVLDISCRMPDPEIQAALSLLQTDLVEIFMSICEDRLDTQDISMHDGYAVCVVLSDKNYPDTFENGQHIKGLKAAARLSDVTLCHCATRCDEEGYFSTGGRVVSVSTTGRFLDETVASAYEAAQIIHFPNAYFREDIGHH